MTFKDILALIGICVAVFVLVFAIVAVPAYYGTKYKCSAVAEQMELPYEWGPVKGCFVKYDNRWVPIDQVRIVK